MKIGPRMAAQLTSVGIVRSENQDAAVVDEYWATDEALVMPLDDGPHLMAVADGMGGHAKGEVASKLALAELLKLRQRILGPADWIDVVKSVNAAVYQAMDDDPARAGMGTTLVGAAVSGERLFWFNVGDSSLFILSGGKLRKLSVDHIPSARLQAGGGRITQSIGGFYRMVDVWPAVGEVDLFPGDVILLCSDGLTAVVDEAALLEALVCADGPETAARDLVGRTLAGGAPDNVTVVVARL